MIRDGDVGELLTCDRCNVDFNFYDDDAAAFHAQRFWQTEIFQGRSIPRELAGCHFCLSCVRTMTPFVYALRDIDETNLFINKLQKAIYERNRNKNNRPDAYHACECGKGRVKRRFVSGQSDGSSQARKEYYGVALFGDEDCHVSA
jgi:hypothetical protein